MALPIFTGSRPRVCLVDDEESVRETCEALLEQEFSVVALASPFEALRRLTNESFDVLCTDYKMPGMDGIELISRALAGAARGAAAVLITAYAEYAVRDKKASTPAFHLLIKPYSAAALRATVQRAVEQSRIQRQLRQVAG